tara:strand:- start:45 stop:227 length:183 start_codon:yes stop_codon:yes gene_type:complete
MLFTANIAQQVAIETAIIIDEDPGSFSPGQAESLAIGVVSDALLVDRASVELCVLMNRDA